MTVEKRPLFDGGLQIMVGGIDVTDEAMNLRYTTTDPGGFGEASFRLPATSPFAAYDADIVSGSPAVVSGAPVVITQVTDDWVLFEGIVTNDVSVATIADGEAYYDIACAGKWYEAGLREDALLALCDTDFTQWEVDERGEPSSYEITNDGQLRIVAKKGTHYNAICGGGLHYWLHQGLGDPNESIDHIIFALGENNDVYDGYGIDLGTSGGNDQWSFEVQVSKSPYEPHIDSQVVAGIFTTPYRAPAGTIYRVPSAAGSSFSDYARPDEPTQCVHLRLFPWIDMTPTEPRYVVIREIYVMMSPDYVPITTIKGFDPATVSTDADHGLRVGDRVYIYYHTADARNGIWTVLSVPDSRTFTIDSESTAQGTGGFLERLPSPVDAMQLIGESIGQDGSYIDPGCYSQALPGPVMVRPYATPAQAMEDLSQQFVAPQSWGWWDDGCYVQQPATIPDSTSEYMYIVDTDDPGTTYDVHANEEGQIDHVRVLYKLSSQIPLSAARLRVTYTPSGGGEQTKVVCPLVFDGFLRSASNSYSTACAGGDAVDVISGDGEVINVGQNYVKTTPRYRLHEAFLKFDLSVIPAGSTITAVGLTLVAKRTRLAQPAYTLRGYVYDFGDMLWTEDWQTPAQLDALTQVAGRTASAFRPDRRIELNDLGAFVPAAQAALDAGTPLSLVLASNRTQNADAPTRSDFINFWSADGNLKSDPLSGQVVQTLVSRDGIEKDPGYVMDASRVAVLDLSEEMLTTADAVIEGDHYLDLQGASSYSGRITVAAPTILYGSNEELSAYVIAGSIIKETHANVPLRITTTEYDVDASKLSMDVGFDPGEYRYIARPEKVGYRSPKRQRRRKG